MRRKLSRLPPNAWRQLGLLLATFALVGQLALGAAILPDPRSTSHVATQLAALDRVGVWCAGSHRPAHRAPLTGHAAADPALCPLILSLWLPIGAMPASAPTISSRTDAAAAAADERPPGRGPPAATARVGPPRAPPILA